MKNRYFIRIKYRCISFLLTFDVLSTLQTLNVSLKVSFTENMKRNVKLLLQKKKSLGSNHLMLQTTNSS